MPDTQNKPLDAITQSGSLAGIKQTPLEIALGWRYFRSRRRNGFVSFIALVSLLGIMLGISALIVVVSVMNGFGNDLRERILGSSTHVIITPKQELLNTKSVPTPLDDKSIRALLANTNYSFELAPYAKGFGMLANRESLAGVNMHGIEPEREDLVTRLSERMLIGSSQALSAGSDLILIGDALAVELNVSVDDEVTLILPQSQAQAVDLTPKLRRYKIAGIFHFDHPEINKRDIYLHKVDLLRLQAYAENTSAYRLRLSDPFAAPEITRHLLAQTELKDYSVSDWTQEQASIFRAVKMEKTVMFILLLLIVAVAAFNIVSTLMMVVKDKRHDIAILRTLGMTPRSVTRIFFAQGMFIGSIGTLAGVGLGVLLTLNINRIMPILESTFGFSLFPKDLMLIQGLPVDIQSGNIVLTMVLALLLTALAAIYPARKAALIEPGEALRYE
ncbi:MAG: lipoprotein-releasing ABC transporter permease subunit [Gammaproteobacteria bacterium]|nr:lipoprotein-releasing ABC transporter permease subunit [Gammaproteobacteria bacterium]NNC96457.1 lipoprotein-releasing ABC transporter permease subunit [Gammaproteobacteria bacterium]NNM14506.1 lipoprotein-releasing ABC transporter permease subunit [Gammaproteobacteria bacterium]